MNAKTLYRILDEDFIKDGVCDDWSFMDLKSPLIAPSFRENYMGLVLDNSDTIEKVYTVTFPNKEIIETILEKKERNLLLFSHHAMGYDGKAEGFPFYDIPVTLMEAMKDNHISFYMLHTPLDRYGPYSTSVSLSKALGLTIVTPFCEYEGIKVGVIAETKLKTAKEFAALVAKTVGHEVKLRPYGEESIRNGLVAIAAGGGSYPFVAREIAENNINLCLTGFTRPLPFFEPTLAFHEIAEENKINVIGATHYSTEKFALLSMVSYFRNLGLFAAFLEGKYDLEDL